MLTTVDGRQVIDAISSWWVTTHGHNHPRISAAIAAQAGKLDQIIFAGWTHEPAEEVAAELVRITPPELTRVFFSDSGSTAVEVALKMALGYWLHRGEPRDRILVLEHSYHGDTIGAMSVGARASITAPMRRCSSMSAPFPFPQRAGDARRAGGGVSGGRGGVHRRAAGPGRGRDALLHARDAGRDARHLRAHGVLFIADEVMTGWGRTGTLLACEQAGVVPDILCLSKGLTGGAVPLAVTLATEAIFQAHWSETDRSKQFFHSSSYTANPIACAAAAANLAIWREEPVQARIDALATAQGQHLAAIGGEAAVRNPRQLGTIAAFELGAGQDYLSDLAPRLLGHFRERDLLVRPMGNTVYVMPPYSITPEQLGTVWTGIAEAIARFGR